MTSEPANKPPTKNPDTASIDFDVSCVRCGYNLRGRPRDGQCSECGQSAELSLSARYLFNADLDWLRIIYRGVVLRVASIVALIVGLLARDNAAFSQSMRVLCFLGLAMLATLLLSRADPAAVEGDPARRSRFVARALSLTAVLAASIPPIFNGSMFPSLFLASVSVAADITYLRHLAERVPDERLAAASQSIGYGVALCVACVALFVGICAVANYFPSGMPDFGPLWFLVPCVVFTLVPVAVLVGLFLLCAYACILRQQIKLAAGRPKGGSM